MLLRWELWRRRGRRHERVGKYCMEIWKGLSSPPMTPTRQRLMEPDGHLIIFTSIFNSSQKPFPSNASSKNAT